MAERKSRRGRLGRTNDAHEPSSGLRRLARVNRRYLAEASSELAPAKKPSSNSGSLSKDEVKQLIQQALSQGGQSGGGSEKSSASNNTAVTPDMVQQMIREALAAQNQDASQGSLSQGQAASVGQLQQAVKQGETASSSQGQSSSSQGASGSGQGNGLGRLKQLVKKSGQNQQGSAGASPTTPSAPSAVSATTSNEETVAQVLTQAQYELSQELEANLTKLRSVIQQSQEIAKKIELVLGHGEKGSGQGS
ncbi:MAG: hypothetical protein OWU84_03510 [Firmicutes bacterium]|nr:hypothetical protein [Bacillota bacterium]